MKVPHKGFVLIATIGSSLLVGCLSEEQPCQGAECDELPSVGSPFLTNATRPLLERSGCHASFAGQDLPRAMFDDHVPEEFDAGSSRPGVANLRMFAMRCERVVLDGAAFEDVFMASTGVIAHPKDPEWNPPGAVPEFVFEVFGSNNTLVSLLRSWGLPAVIASISMGVEAQGSLVHQSWVVAAEDRSYAWTERYIDENGGSLPHHHAYWAGPEPYSRVDCNNTGIHGGYGGLGIDPLVMQGDAKLSSIVGAHVMPVLTQAYRVYSDSCIPNQTKFGRALAEANGAGENA